LEKKGKTWGKRKKVFPRKKLPCARGERNDKLNTGGLFVFGQPTPHWEEGGKGNKAARSKRAWRKKAFEKRNPSARRERFFSRVGEKVASPDKEKSARSVRYIEEAGDSIEA